MREIWKEINFLKEVRKPYYVSNLGRIKNSKGKIMKFNQDKDGYLKKSFYIETCNGKKRFEHHRVHRVVARMFLDNPFGYDCVHLKDGNKTNACVDNLQWMSKIEVSKNN